MRKLLLGFVIGAVGGTLLGIGIVGPSLNGTTKQFSNASSQEKESGIPTELQMLLNQNPTDSFAIKTLQNQLTEAMKDPNNSKYLTDITKKLVSMRNFGASAEKQTNTEPNGVSRAILSANKEEKTIKDVKPFALEPGNVWQTMRQVETYIKELESPVSIINKYNEVLQSAINEEISLADAREAMLQVAEAAYSLATE